MPASEKDFDTWNREKKRIEVFGYWKDSKDGDVWWCALGTNIGSEQDGTGNGYERPVLILKTINRRLSNVIPLTTSKTQDKYRIFIGEVNGVSNTALLSQIRIIDSKRLVRKMGRLDPCIFLYIRETARNLF